MPRALTASDRKNLIRLASSLPKGSEERRAILAGLKIATFRNQKFIPQSPASAKGPFREETILPAMYLQPGTTPGTYTILTPLGNPRSKSAVGRPHAENIPASQVQKYAEKYFEIVTGDRDWQNTWRGGINPMPSMVEAMRLADKGKRGAIVRVQYAMFNWQIKKYGFPIPPERMQ